MKKFKQILSLIAEAKLEPGGEDLGDLFGPKGRFSPKSKNAPRERTAQQRMKSGNLTPNPDRPSGMEELLRRNPPEKGQKEQTYNARIQSGEIDAPPMPSEPTPARTKKPSAAKRPTRSFPVVTNNMHHEGHLMRSIESERELREMMKAVSPGFMKHSDALTAALREYHESTGGKASKYERGLFAHNLITSHLDSVADKLGNLNSKGLPIKEKFGKARISHTSQDTSVDGERTLKIHFHPFKTHISGSSDINELTQHLEKKTGHAYYVHLDNRRPIAIGTKNNPLILATAVNSPHLRGEDDGGDDDGNKPEKTKPKNPTGKQPTRPRAPTRPRMPSLV